MTASVKAGLTLEHTLQTSSKSDETVAKIKFCEYSVPTNSWSSIPIYMTPHFNVENDEMIHFSVLNKDSK